MSSRDVSSSDLELARVLSRRVSAPVAPSGQSLPTTSPLRYTRFSAARFGAAAAQPGGATVAVAPPPEPSSFATWDALVDWCLAHSGAASAFVMEPQGFSIAQRGHVTEDVVQGVGANLMLICSRAERLEEPGGGLRSVTLEFEGGWLYVFRQPVADSGPLLVAFVSSRELPDEVRAAVRRQVERNAAHL